MERGGEALSAKEDKQLPSNSLWRAPTLEHAKARLVNEKNLVLAGSNPSVIIV